jgi:NDP-sugar pyrophosphorylase family protein
MNITTPTITSSSRLYLPTLVNSQQRSATTSEKQPIKADPGPVTPASARREFLPSIKVKLSPEASGKLALLPTSKPNLFNMMLTQDGKTYSAGLLRNLKHQVLTAHITKNGLVMEVKSRSVGQSYYIFPGGEYRSESGLFIKLWTDKHHRQQDDTPLPQKSAATALIDETPTTPKKTDATTQGITTQALIPVGGQATRLAPLTQLVPKPAIPIDTSGQTLIGRLVSHMHNHDIKHVIITTRVMPDLIKRALKFLKKGEPHVTYVQEPFAQGDIGSLLTMLKKPDFYGLDVNQPLLVAQGDAYTQANFSQLLKAHKKHNAAITFAFKTVTDDEVDQFGIMATDGSGKDKVSGKIDFFIEKPKPTETPHRNANTGILVISPEVLKVMPDIYRSVGKPQKVNFSVHIMPELLKRIKAGDIKDPHGKPMVAWAQQLDKRWHDVGRPNSYFEVHEDRENNGTVFWPGAEDKDMITVAGNVIALKNPPLTTSKKSEASAVKPLPLSGKSNAFDGKA